MTENYSEDSMTPWRYQQSSCEKSGVLPNALYQQSPVCVLLVSSQVHHYSGVSKMVLTHKRDIEESNI